MANGFAETGELIALSGGDAGVRAACHTCHGIGGEGDGNLTPRIAGLDPGYIARQLIFFAEGQRSDEHMSPIARQLPAGQRIRVAEYYARMEAAPGEPKPSVRLDCELAGAALYLRGDPQRGLEACATCHGRDATGVGRGTPPLLGQPAPYIAHQLRAWRSGKRYGDPQGVMRFQAELLAEDEISRLADYISHIGDGSDRPEFREECLRPHRRDSRNDA